MQKRMQPLVYLINFLFSLSGAITLYTNSSFISGTVGIELVGVLYAISAALSIVILSHAGTALERVGNRMFFLGYGALYSLSLLLLILPFGIPIRIVALFAYLTVTNVLIFSANIFFQHLAPKEGRGKARGIYLLLGNTGILLGPMIATHAIDYGGYAAMYVCGIALFAVIALVIEFGFRRYADAEYHFGHIETAIRHTMREQTLRNVISANFILQFFYAWMVVYTPIYLVQHLGFSWDSVGIIFTAMLTTFVILDYPLGRLADKLGSEKELASIGFLIMALSVFGLSIVHAPSVLMVGVILFCSRVGAATVEAMTEIHFFKLAKETDPGLLSLFSDLRPLSYILAPLLGALALVFLPFRMMFAVLGVILIFGFFVAVNMEKTHTWWKRAHRV